MDQNLKLYKKRRQKSPNFHVELTGKYFRKYSKFRQKIIFQNLRFKNFPNLQLQYLKTFLTQYFSKRKIN